MRRKISLFLQTDLELSPILPAKDLFVSDAVEFVLLDNPGADGKAVAHIAEEVWGDADWARQKRCAAASKRINRKIIQIKKLMCKLHNIRAMEAQKLQGIE